MNKYERLTLYLSILVFALMSLSFRWPVDAGRITSSFGESRGDHFHDGIDMVCPDDKIYPVDSGKLVYYRDETIFPLDVVPGGAISRYSCMKKACIQYICTLKRERRE